MSKAWSGALSRARVVHVFEDSRSSSPRPGWCLPGVERAREPVLPTVDLSEARRLVEAALAADPAQLGDAQVLTDTAALFELVDRVQALGVRYLAEVDRRGLHRLDDSPTTTAWVKARALPVGGAQITLARRLDAHPLVTGQLLGGQVPLAVAQRLQAALGRLRPFLDRPDGRIDGQPAEQALSGVVMHGGAALVAEARGGFRSDEDALALRRELEAVLASPQGELRRVEAAFLVLAREVEADQLEGALRQLTDALLPAQLEERARKAADSAELSLHAEWGSGRTLLSAVLSPECAELLHTVITAEMARDPERPLDTEHAARLRAQGLDPYDPELTCLRPRSRGEQRHDALKAALTRYLAADLGGQHNKQPVQIVVTVSAETLEGASGALPARGTSGAHLPVSLVRRWGCRSTLVRQVLDLRRQVIETSHTSRTLKAHERRALLTQTAGVCQGAGCTRSARSPGALMHPHHGTPWARARSTSLADSVLLCERTHQDLHEGKTIRLKDGRRLGPDGWLE